MKANSNSKNCVNCGSNHKSKPYCVFDNGSHCFSCGYSSFIDNSFSVKEKKEQSFQTSFEFVYPSTSLLKKLLDYNITYEKALEYNILFSDDDSVIYPITDLEGNNTGYQQRWLLSGERKIKTFGATATSLHNKHNSNTLVFVEDYLSAKRVAEQYNTVCLWGTNLKKEALKELVYFFDVFYIWLDNDATKKENSGQIAAQKIKDSIRKEAVNSYYTRGYTLLNKEVINIVTEKDPKYYTNSEIKQIIGDHHAAHNESKLA